MITRTFKLCLNAGTGSAPFINVSQTDKDEVWLFELYTETGERYIPSSGAIIGIKSDGHGIANTGTVDSEGRVVITETEQMTAAAGRSIFELSIDGLTHGTANFIVNVEKKPIDGAIMSDSDLSLISQAVDSAAVIVDVIGDGDPSEVIGEHVDAWLDNHPEATTTVEDGAITAPKINQSLWDKLLVSEEASGNPASFSDGADDVPVSSLKVALEPVQLGIGDPSPSNVRPIIAANGRNLFKLRDTDVTSTDGGITIAYNAQHDEYTISGTNTNTSAHLVINRAPLVIPSFVAGETYCASLTKPTGGMYYLNLTYKTASDVIKGFTMTAIETNKSWRFTVPSDFSTFYHFQIGVYGTTTTIPTTVFGIQIEKDSAPSVYQPYQGIMVDVVGKNLIDIGAFNTGGTSGGVTVAVNASENYYTMNGTATDININYWFIGSYNTGRNVLHLDAGTYYYKGINLYERDAPITSLTRGDVGDFFTLTTALDIDGIRCISATVGETYNNEKIYPYLVKLNDTSVVPPFTPYTSASYPYTLGQSVYGGTVDLATGVLTVTHGIYTVSAVDSLVTKTGFIRVRSTNPTEAYASSSNEKNAITNNMVFNYAGIIGFNGNTSIPFSFFVAEDYTYFVLPTSAATDVATANTWFTNNPTTVVYPLATPQTIQLTPQEVKTLLGYNNISSSGTVDVIYHADTKLYVDKMTNVDNAIIAPTEVDFVATRNYTVNDLLIVADTLYKVTANIASGSAITPNSNVTQTTLSALIKALS